MKASLLGWLSAFGTLAASLGAVGHSVITDGVASPTQFGVGGTLAAAVIAVIVKLHADWKAAGGKLDGRITSDEAKSLIDSALKQLKAPQPLIDAADALAGQAADLGNRAIASIEQKVPNATALIDLATEYLTAHEEENDPDHAAVLWKFIDVVSKEITGDKEGEDAAAKLRVRLDEKLFPGGRQTVPLNPTA